MPKPLSTPNALAVMRKHLHDTLRIAISAMNPRWACMGLWLRQQNRRGSTKIYARPMGPVPHGLGRNCLLWVARQDTLQAGIRKGLGVQGLDALGQLHLVQGVSSDGAVLVVVPQIAQLPLLDQACLV